MRQNKVGLELSAQINIHLAIEHTKIVQQLVFVPKQPSVLSSRARVLHHTGISDFGNGIISKSMCGFKKKRMIMNVHM